MRFKRSCTFGAYSTKYGVFYPFVEQSPYVIGILEAHDTYHADVVAKLNDSPFTLITEEYAYHTGMSGASDYQPKFKYHTYYAVDKDKLPEIAFLPRSWHVTMSGKLQDPIYHIAFIKIEDLEKIGESFETRLFRASKLEARIMAFTTLPDRKERLGWFVTDMEVHMIEHGIPFKGYLRKIADFRGKLDTEGWIGRHELAHGPIEFEFDPIKLQLVIQSPSGFRWEFPMKSVTSSRNFLNAKSENYVAHFHIKNLLEGRKLLVGYIADCKEKTAQLFEEYQPIARVRIDNCTTDLNALDRFDEYRLGDIVFLPWTLSEELPFLRESSWEEVLSNPKIKKIDIGDKAIVCHEEHGCIRVDAKAKLYAFQYLHALD